MDRCQYLIERFVPNHTLEGYITAFAGFARILLNLIDTVKVGPDP